MKDSKRVMLGNKDEFTDRSSHSNMVRGSGQNSGLSVSASARMPNDGCKLAVFRDADGSARSSGVGHGPPASDLGRREMHRQEDARNAKEWSGEILLQKKIAGFRNMSSRGPGKALLRVLRDLDEDGPENEAQRSPNKANPLSLKPIFGSQHPEVDILKRDPFRL